MIRVWFVEKYGDREKQTQSSFVCHAESVVRVGAETTDCHVERMPQTYTGWQWWFGDTNDWALASTSDEVETWLLDHSSVFATKPPSIFVLLGIA